MSSASTASLTGQTPTSSESTLSPCVHGALLSLGQSCVLQMQACSRVARRGGSNLISVAERALVSMVQYLVICRHRSRHHFSPLHFTRPFPSWQGLFPRPHGLCFNINYSSIVHVYLLSTPSLLPVMTFDCLFPLGLTTQRWQVTLASPSLPVPTRRPP